MQAMTISQHLVELLSEMAGINLGKEFVSHEHNGEKGALILTGPEQSHEVLVTVPNGFPLEKIRFHCPELKPIDHCIEPDGWICLRTPFVPDEVTQLKIELNALKEWYRRFVVQGETEDRYEYPIIPSGARKPLTFLFTEEIQDERTPSSTIFGKFSFELKPGSLPRDLSNWQVFTCQGLGLETSRKDQESGKWGYWILLGEDPKLKYGGFPKTWKEVNAFLPLEMSFELEMVFSSFEKSPYPLEYFPIMLGWQIEGPEGFEIHWEAILLDPKFFPWKREFKNPLTKDGYRKMTPHYEAKSLVLGRTFNIAYERFFGRGRFCETLTEAKVLIIGLGAIGGMLAETLARGGCKDLYISDSDRVLPGNICRSVYGLTEIGASKLTSIAYQLKNISPTISIQKPETVKIPILFPGTPDFQEQKKQFSTLDFIFDCTGENRLCWMLDQMELPGAVIHLSISDNAEAMLCLTESGDKLEAKSRLFEKMSLESSPASFFEGNGCYHPTFRASFTDIAALLHQVLVQINHRLSINFPLVNFAIHRKPQGANVHFQLVPDD